MHFSTRMTASHLTFWYISANFFEFKVDRQAYCLIQLFGDLKIPARATRTPSPQRVWGYVNSNTPLRFRNHRRNRTPSPPPPEGGSASLGVGVDSPRSSRKKHDPFVKGVGGASFSFMWLRGDGVSWVTSKLPGNDQAPR